MRPRIAAHRGAWNPLTPRALDHLVLPTRDLNIARRRLEQLGFTVAPVGRHPFGTENACVYFADGTFLEPLAVYDGNLRTMRCAPAMSLSRAIGHTDIGKARTAFRPSFSSTEDAEADHEQFIEDGYSAGPVLDFSRAFVGADGRTDQASFRLAFAADMRAPDVFLFTCQRVRAPTADRSRASNACQHRDR